jgi:hypothetical protein
LIEDKARTLDLADVVDEARALRETSAREFEVLVLFDRTPSGKSPRPLGWSKTRRVRFWLASNGISEEALPPQAHGGLILTIRSRDPYSALTEAGAIADRLAARVAVGTRSAFRPLDRAFVAGIARPLLLRQSRRVDVHSLDRHHRLYDLDGDASIDSAIELLSHLDYGQGPVGVAGGWSAVEFLLSGPGDAKNVLAGDRLSALVACSWPRAELTTIARNRMNEIDDTLSDELKAKPTNRDRCDRLVAEIAAGAGLKLVADSERAAEHRMERLVSNPAKVLQDVFGYAQESLRRLYRQRNLVLHGGRTRGVALEATLRTAAPLVGAGVDRIVHANLTANLTPLHAAARAEFELLQAHRLDGSGVTALLE